MEFRVLLTNALCSLDQSLPDRHEGFVRIDFQPCPAFLRNAGSDRSTSTLTPQSTDIYRAQDYFSSTVSAVKRVILNYGPDGRSRGSATVSFHKPGAAAEAVKLDGTKVDGRAMRV